MDRPNDLDEMKGLIVDALSDCKHDDIKYWSAINMLSSMYAELIFLRGFKEATLAYQCGEHRREEER